MPFFSVIIPTYNRADAVVNAINSVLSQTFSDFEILVMDDGSTDDTKEQVLQLQDPRIVYDWSPNTGGPASPRNRGVRKATGQWICFLDADDFWANRKLEVCYKSLSEQVDFIYHDLYLITDRHSFDAVKKMTGRQVKKPVLKDLLTKGNPICTSSVVVRKDTIFSAGEFNETAEMVATEDFNMWLRISKFTEKFKYINSLLGYYLHNGSGISTKNMKDVYLNAIRSFLPCLSGIEKNKAMAHAAYINARYLFVHRKYAEAIEDLGFCIRYGNPGIKLKSVYMMIRVKLN